MAEIVNLHEYRLAKAAIEKREEMRRWTRLRFKDLSDLDFFTFPLHLDGVGEIYLKSDAVVDPLGVVNLEEGPAIWGGTRDFLVPADMSVIPLSEE